MLASREKNPDLLALAQKWVEAGVTRRKAKEIDKARKDMGLPPMFK